MQPSPYTPGEVAREVHGRTQQLVEIDERLAYMVDLQRLVGRIRVEVGPRGLGKTSLLREVQRRAEARGALTVWITAGADPSLVGGIGAEIGRRTHDWGHETRRRMRNRLDSLRSRSASACPDWPSSRRRGRRNMARPLLPVFASSKRSSGRQ